jgi:hypothetical protein
MSARNDAPFKVSSSVRSISLAGAKTKVEAMVEQARAQAGLKAKKAFGKAKS